MCEVIKGFEGFLFIGDSHLVSSRPGRRIDDYSTAILGKLSQSARIAKERRLYPVHLGDLFHRARENSLELLSRTAAVLREFEVPLPLEDGSHDRTESWYTEKDAVSLLAGFGLLRLMDKPGKVLTLDINGELVTLWVAPAGSRVPTSIPADPGTRNILITHHDFDFNGKYPGAHELHEIEGCDLMVNGHMHHPAPMVLKGRTACHNPGSISRPSVDLVKHQPVVSVWTPAHNLNLEPVPLEHVKDVFDMTGKEAFAADPRDLKAALPKGLRLSTFATKLRATESLEAGRTDDGSVMVEALENYFKLFEKPDNLKRYMTGLVAEVIEERLAA
jgi:hypothetical protein